uniref:glycosyltransferase n=1 Tax=Candidatus Ventrenecus sp. TaxID=3085654 RepID=UPI0040297F77
MKNICLYSEKWTSGGIESFLVNLVELLSKKYKFTIVTSQKETDIYDERLKNNNCKVITMNKSVIRNPIKRTLFSIINFKKTIKNGNYDIVHINMYNSMGLFYAYLIKKLDLKIICHAHNTGIDNDKFYLKRLVNFLVKKLFTKKNYIYLACSHDAAAFCFKEKLQKLKIINNGIETEKFIFNLNKRKKIRKELNIAENDIVVGHVGRFVLQKNHVFLVDIFKEFLKMEPNSKLILIGTGETKDVLMKNLSELKIEKNTFIFEIVKNVNEYLQAFDLFLFPSLYEGLGIVLIEAQAAGLKCFASDTVPKDAKISENLIFVSLSSSAKQWANIMKDNLDYKRLNMLNIVKSNNFDRNSIMKNMEEIYE